MTEGHRRCCEMKGYLSFLILWIISKKASNGAMIASEIEIRKGNRPSPGTIYPVLKDLREKKLLMLQDGKYSLTPLGKQELHVLHEDFCKIFHDIRA